MSLRIHDTLSGSMIPFPQRTPGEASIYVCGPTVYGLIHVGNARPPITFDFLHRHLLAKGLKVTFVQNFTDVDDKIIRASLENNEDPRVLAQRYVDAYLQDMKTLCVTRPTHQPRVSTTMPEIIAMVEALIARGHAYELEGDVYFSVRTFKGYGKLSRKNIDELNAGERVSVDERKRDPLDFALWKAAKPHEPEGARWASPWGEGRPGWHIECSAMAQRWLGHGFDLHGGGTDLVFPHHENEIAQSECSCDQPFASAWMHNGFINVNGSKMAKSQMESYGFVRRFFMLRNLLEYVDGEAIRWWMAGTHYRLPLNFDIAVDPDSSPENPNVHFPSLEEAEKRVEYMYEARVRLTERAERLAAKAPKVKKPVDAVIALRTRFDEHMDDDLNTAGALAVTNELYRRVNEFCDSNSKDAVMAEALASLVAHTSRVLGVAEGDANAFFDRVKSRRIRLRSIDPNEIEARIQDRVQARAQREFARADEIRAELSSRGIELRDNPDGTTQWKIA